MKTSGFGLRPLIILADVKAAHKRRMLHGIVCGLLALTCNTACFGAGVTVITHGYHLLPGDAGSVAGWLNSIADEIANRAGGSSATVYSLKIGTPLLNPYPFGPIKVLSFKRESGPVVSSSSSLAEIIIKVDWTDLDGGYQCNNAVPTLYIAETIVPALKQPKSLALDDPSQLDLDLPAEMNSFLELPIHLIGHSRGGSVAADVARQLGELGCWVDQVTTLDPHPIACDAPVLLQDNIVFADNYYQELAFWVKGIPLPDTFYRKLTDLNAGYDNAHSDVHLWYFGTIKLGDGVPNGDGQTITSSMRGTWYWGSEERGSQTGFYFSRLGGGERFRPERGMLGKHLSLSREAQGAIRFPPAIGGAQWPNIASPRPRERRDYQLVSGLRPQSL